MQAAGLFPDEQSSRCVGGGISLANQRSGPTCLWIARHEERYLILDGTNGCDKSEVVRQNPSHVSQERGVGWSYSISLVRVLLNSNAPKALQLSDEQFGASICCRHF